MEPESAAIVVREAEEAYRYREDTLSKRERRERIASQIMAGLAVGRETGSTSEEAWRIRHDMARLATDLADALIAELDRV